MEPDHDMVALHATCFRRPRVAGQLLTLFGSAHAVLSARHPPPGLLAAGWAAVQALRTEAQQVDVDALRATAQRRGLAMIPLTSPRYPLRLKTIPDPPLILFVRGDQALFDDRPTVAIVGARRPTTHGCQTVALLATGLAARGVTIVSGLAFGIDKAAHRATLDAAGPTIAVLASGADRITPESNFGLGAEILAATPQGAICSEFLPGAPSLPHHYPQRNRVISGLADLVIIGDCQIASGTLHTARHALDQDRTLCAIPGLAGAAMSAGPHHLLRQGAALVESVADVCDLLPLDARGGQQGAGNGMGPALRRWLRRGRRVDEIVTWLGQPAHQVLALLATAELAGEVEQQTQGVYRTRWQKNSSL